MEVASHDSYVIKMDGSGRVTRRNRQFLKPIRGYIEILRESGQKRLVSDDNRAKTHDLRCETAASARGGAQGGPPAPIRSESLLMQRGERCPAGESAVDRAREPRLSSGPRNTSPEMSSSTTPSGASDTVSETSNVQTGSQAHSEVQVQVEVSRHSGQPQPSQVQPVNVRL